MLDARRATRSKLHTEGLKVSLLGGRRTKFVDPGDLAPEICAHPFVVVLVYSYRNVDSTSIWLGKRPLGDQDVDGRIILRWIFRKWEWVVGTGWGWLRIGTGGGRL